MNSPSPVRFNCLGCGNKCCTGRFVPLTLDEASAWLGRGSDVVVILEAFANELPASRSSEYLHHEARSAVVRCGSEHVNLIVILAASNLSGCPHLGPHDACTIYDERPLVCRIYPMEINPHIALEPRNKECPPHAWNGTSGEFLIASDGQPPADLRVLIEESRAADRADAVAKVAVCQEMGLTTAAWKHDGIVVHLPDQQRLKEVIERVSRVSEIDFEIQIRTGTASLEKSLNQNGLAIAQPSPDSHFFSFTG